MLKMTSKALSTRIRFHYVSVFFTDTASVHTYPMKTVNEKETCRRRFPKWNFLTTLFSRVRVDRRKRGTFRKRWGHNISSKSLRAIFETYSRWRTDASLSCLLLGLNSNLIAFFQANLALIKNKTQTAVINIVSFRIFINLTFRMLFNIHFQKWS